jgi:hypothetical protein
LPYESARLDGRRIHHFCSIEREREREREREKEAKKMGGEWMKEIRQGSKNEKKFSVPKTTK